MKQPGRTKNAGIYKALYFINGNEKRKEHFSGTFIPEYLEVSKNCVTHTFSPPIVRALIYLFSVSPQRGVAPFCGLIVYYPCLRPGRSVVMAAPWRTTTPVMESIIMYHLITRL